MGKSLGNAIPVKEMLQRHDAMTIRFFVLSSHYRSPTDFGESALVAAGRGLERLTGTVGLVRDQLRNAEIENSDADPDWMAKLDDYQARFEEGMNDDLNTPRAIATLFDLGREVNSLLNSDQAISRGTLEAIDTLYRRLGGDVLGIRFDDFYLGAASRTDGDLVDNLVGMLIEMRQQARQNRDWTRADAIRDRLAEMGITLEDGPEGTRWRLNR
jgi:cysteinyl-tRNA synthetase